MEAEAVAPIEAKGKAEPVSAYRLLSVPFAPAHRRRSRTPLVGRERELAALRSLYDDALAKSAAMVALLTGEPGVGKSRLAEEFLSTVAADARVLSGRCLPYGEGITYWPLAEIVRSAAGIHDEHGVEEARARLGRLLEEASGGEAIAALLAHALGLSEGVASPPEIAWAARRLGEVLAEERPLVLLLDDLQWAEEALLDLIRGIGERGKGRILLLCLARPEFLETHPWSATVRLAPLDVHDAAELAAQLLGARGGTSDRVVAAAGGNPLFLEELSAMLAEA